MPEHILGCELVRYRSRLLPNCDLCVVLPPVTVDVMLSLIVSSATWNHCDAYGSAVLSGPGQSSEGVQPFSACS